jgi:hypothetical protein
MVVFLRRRLIRFVLLAVAAPLLGALALWASERMEAERGRSHVSSGLRVAGHLLRRVPGA